MGLARDGNDQNLRWSRDWHDKSMVGLKKVAIIENEKRAIKGASII